MAASSDRKVIGRYVYSAARKVRFSTATGFRETTCLTDVVRDLVRSRMESNEFTESGVPWSASELARQIGIAPSSLHAITNGDREPNLTHLERMCALGNSTVLEVLWATPDFLPQSVIDKIRAGENPFADLRLRGNLTEDQIERIGRVAERAATSGSAEWVVKVLETAAEALP